MKMRQLMVIKQLSAHFAVGGEQLVIVFCAKKSFTGLILKNCNFILLMLLDVVLKLKSNADVMKWC
jgi:hypothetical protein